jgi:carbonic anhydrase/acetyltransferase-like protein (isoleucine patch superfamily)
MLVPLDGHEPMVDLTAYVAPSADLIGRVELAARASVWFNAVLRGDQNRLLIGEETNVQDGVVIHADPPDIGGLPVTVGARSTIGHGVVLHGCDIGSRVLVGNGAIVLDGARIGSGSLVAAGTLVTPGVEVPDGSIVMGSPGRVTRQVSDEDLGLIDRAADTYLALVARYTSAAPARGTR